MATFANKAFDFNKGAKENEENNLYWGRFYG